MRTLVVFVSLSIAAVGCDYSNNLSIPKLPDLHHVKSITVELFSLPFEEGVAYEFELPSQHISTLLSFLPPGRYFNLDERSISKSLIGKLDIHLKNGSMVRLGLISSG